MKCCVLMAQGHTLTIWRGKPGHGAPPDHELLSKVSLDPDRVQRVYIVDDADEPIKALWVSPRNVAIHGE